MDLRVVIAITLRARARHRGRSLNLDAREIERLVAEAEAAAFIATVDALEAGLRALEEAQDRALACA